MKRYLRLIAVFLKANIALFFIYRADFYNSLIATIGWVTLSVIGISFITDQAPLVGGWSRYELLLVMGTYALITGIFYFIFPRNFFRFTEYIREGKLDGVLVKPVDSQFLATVGIVSFAHLFRSVYGIGLIWYCIGMLHITVTPILLGEYIFVAVCSLILLYSIWLFVSTLAIWFTDVTNLLDIIYEITGLARFPEEIFRVLPLAVFYMLLPIVLVTTVPVKILLHSVTPETIFGMVGITMIAFGISRKFWLYSLRFYTSASS